jgi:hypothetical protein
LPSGAGARLMQPFLNAPLNRAGDQDEPFLQGPHGGSRRSRGGPSASLSISKNKLPVRVEFEGGLVKYGFVFLRNNQRALDMFCDDRRFIPLETKTGIVLINKNTILAVALLEGEQFDAEAEHFATS